MQHIFEYADRHIETFTDELMQVCRQPSISATGEGIPEMADALVDMLSGMGATAQLLSTKGAPVVYGRFAGKSRRALMFYDHFDVVPPGDLDAWDSAPFIPEVRDGTLYGRGVADDKGVFMCRAKAVESLLATEGSLPVSVIFVVEGENESGSPHLAEFVEAHKDLLRADGIVWEGGSKNFDDTPEIGLGVKGWCGVEVRLKTANRDLHSGYATVAPNALWSMVRLLQTLKRSDGRIAVSGFYDNIRPPTPEDLVLVNQIPYSWEGFREGAAIKTLEFTGTDSETMAYHLFQPTCNIVGLAGGYTGEGQKTKTVVPHRATARLGFRLVPDQDPEDVLDKVTQHLQAHTPADIEVIRLGATRPCRAPLDSDICRAAVVACEDVYGRKPIVYPLRHGTSPMATLALRLGIPAVMAGPASACSNRQGPNENLRIEEDYLAGIKHMAALIKRFAQLPG